MYKLVLLLSCCLILSQIIQVQGKPYLSGSSAIERLSNVPQLGLFRADRVWIPIYINTSIGHQTDVKDDCKADMVIPYGETCKCGTTPACAGGFTCIDGNTCSVLDFFITRGKVLNKGDVIQSMNGEYKLLMKKNGNLVIYKSSDNSKLWSTGTDTKTCLGNTFTFQTDGNLVVYDDKNVVCWQSNTGGKHALILILRDDGILALMRGATVLWTSGDSEVPLNTKTEEPIYTATEEPITTKAEEPITTKAEEPINTKTEEPLYSGETTKNIGSGGTIEYDSGSGEPTEGNSGSEATTEEISGSGDTEIDSGSEATTEEISGSGDTTEDDSGSEATTEESSGSEETTEKISGSEETTEEISGSGDTTEDDSGSEATTEESSGSEASTEESSGSGSEFGEPDGSGSGQPTHS